MHLRKLVAVAATAFCFALAAAGQTDPAPQAPADSASKPETGSSRKSSRKKRVKKTSSSKKSRKSKKKKSSAPAASVQSISSDAQANVTDDGEAPQLSHQAIGAGARGKAVTVAVHAADPNGVYGPVLYVRKKGMGAGDYVAIRMVASKIVPGDYAVDVPAGLTNVDGLEYYVEAWDMAGNGPARIGSADQPLSIRVDEDQKPSAPVAPTNVTIRPRGVPPAITHAAVTQALRGKPVEINARLVGDTGVQGAAVMFRRTGDMNYKALPMGNIGGDDYTATIPAAMTTTDLEYYLEAYDQYGNGPARSGAPNVPYQLKVADAAPAVAAAAPPEPVHKRVLEEEESDSTVIGLGVDGGLPAGGLVLLVRPLSWLRLNGGLAYNAIGFGFRGGITLTPGQWGVTPSLNIDAGRFLSGDMNKYVTFTDPGVRSLFSATRYTFATAQVGLEMGSQRRFSFYLRGGMMYVLTKFPKNGLNAIAAGNLGSPDTTISFGGDGRFTALLPCFSAGFNIFIY